MGFISLREKENSPEEGHGTMKIGILTHYNVYNQGTQLQMSATRYWLEKHGHQVVILTYDKNFDFRDGAKARNSGSFSSFPYYIRHYLLEKGLGLTWFNTCKVLAMNKSLKQYMFAPHNDSGCDAIIIGSDEVYSIDVGINKMMYGHDLGGVPAIAYAPSFGIATLEKLEQFGCTETVRTGLAKTRFLSARDLHTQKMVETLTGREVPLVCDPVVLYSGGYNSNPKPIGKPYLAVYSYSRNMVDPDEIAAIRAYAKAHGLITVSLGTYHGWCDKNVACTAEDWYGYFKDAACVVTDTFHGSVVAMKNHCNVAVFIRESINAFKLRSLLKETGLEDRRLQKLTVENLESVLSKSIDYDAVDDWIDRMTKESEAYLLNALETVYAER